MRRSAVLPGLSFALLIGCAQPALATEAVVADYMLACQGCHLPDGSGHPAHGVPALKGFVGNFLRVEGGREFLLRVPGVTQSELSDARLARVLNWSLATFSPRETPPDAAPFTAEEVGRWRRQPLTNIQPLRAQLVARITQKVPAARGRS